MSRRLYDGKDPPAKYANVDPSGDDLGAYRSYQQNEVSNGDGGSCNGTIETFRYAVSV